MTDNDSFADYNSDVERFREQEYPMLEGVFITLCFDDAADSAQIPSTLIMQAQHCIQSLSWSDLLPT